MTTMILMPVENTNTISPTKRYTNSSAPFFSGEKRACAFIYLTDF